MFIVVHKDFNRVGRRAKVLKSLLCNTSESSFSFFSNQIVTQIDMSQTALQGIEGVGELFRPDITDTVPRQREMSETTMALEKRDKTLHVVVIDRVSDDGSRLEKSTTQENGDEDLEGSFVKTNRIVTESDVSNLFQTLSKLIGFATRNLNPLEADTSDMRTRLDKRSKSTPLVSGDITFTEDETVTNNEAVKGKAFFVEGLLVTVGFALLGAVISFATNTVIVKGLVACVNISYALWAGRLVGARHEVRTRRRERTSRRRRRRCRA